MTSTKPPSPVRGVELDARSRCAHYNSPLDIIAIRMKCCGDYYACKDCHDAMAGHAIRTWPKSDWGQPAVLCGACGIEMTIHEYLHCANICPTCRSAFNPGCRHHYHFYFDMD